jgi:hypothetical protein
MRRADLLSKESYQLPKGASTLLVLARLVTVSIEAAATAEIRCVLLQAWRARARARVM